MADAEITLLIDGACPVCRQQADFLRRFDRGRGRLGFEDISREGFDGAEYGVSRAEANARIHGILPDGTVLSGMEVIRRAYRAVGLGWLVAPTGWPGLRRMCDAAYVWFARNRPRLGRSGGTCDAGHCPASGENG